MRSRWFHAPVLHIASEEVQKKVTWLELFYDLIFVAAFIQLGNGLSGNISLQGALAFAGAFIPLWVVWTGFTFFENRYSVDDFVHRIVVLLQMFCVAGMAIAATDLLKGDSFAFSVAAGLGHCLVSVMHFRAFRQTKNARDYSLYWGAVFGGTGLVWLLASALAAPYSYVAWAIASLAFLASPISKTSRELTERYPIDWEHLSERYGLLTIIVLGESFVKVLTVLVTERAGLTLFIEGGFALLITCGVWWVYFDDVAGAKIRTEKGQWIVWLFAHIPLQIGVTALAIGIKKAIHFDWLQPAPEKYRWLLAGALALVYFSVAAIDSVSERRQAELSDRARINARWMSGLLLLVMAPAGRTMSGGAFLIMVSAVNVAQVIFDMMIAPQEQNDEMEKRARSTHEVHQASLALGRQHASARVVSIKKAVRKGAPSSIRADLYSYFLSGSWTRVFVAFGIAFVLSNVFFAGLFVLEPNGIAGARSTNFLDAFFFSVQTMSTIGYGSLSPRSDYVSAVASVEAAVSMIGIAIVTGLVFAKASRPQSAVLFSRFVTVNRYYGKQTLTFRLGNARGNDIVDATVQVVVLKDQVSPEGQHLRRFFDLKLERSRNPYFALGWNVMHIIDDESPLADVDWNNIEGTMGMMTVSMTGHDGTYGATTYARHVFHPKDLRLNHRFVDVLSKLEDGRLMIDYEKFHDTVKEKTEID